MDSLKQIYQKKINEVESQDNLNKLQKKKKIGAFINNTLYILDVIQTRQNKKNSLLINNEFAKNISGEYSWVSREDFQKQVKNNILFQECMEFLKKNELIDVFKKDGREYYVHFSNGDQSLNVCSKGYKLTDKCKKIIASTTQKQFEDFINQYQIERKRYTQPTPKEVMDKVVDNYWFSNTKANIAHVLENNLELEFHPTTVQELVDLYNQQRKEDGEKEASREEIELEIFHRLDQYVNKDFCYNIRLYNAFTNTPRSWRKFVTAQNGSKIDELFDIHSSVLNILPLVCRIELLKNRSSQETIKQFEAEEQVLEYMLQRDVYTTIGAGIYSRQQIKDALMKVLFSNNKSFENVANVELTAKGKTKNTAANKIRFWLKDNFPIMFDVLAHFEEKQVKDAKSKWTKKKSQYWKAFQQLETELMCELIVRVENKFGTKVYSLHDGCFRETELYSTKKNDQMVQYCKSEYNNLKEELKQLINERYFNLPCVEAKEEIKIEPPKPVYKAVDNKIVEEEPEVTDELVELLSAGLE